MVVAVTELAESLVLFVSMLFDARHVSVAVSVIVIIEVNDVTFVVVIVVLAIDSASHVAVRL